MPLHLLGKKSWNVYNTASIERVRRDEAAARAREEAEEQRMQEEDAARRTALLRGESVADIAVTGYRPSASAGPSDFSDNVDALNADSRSQRFADATPAAGPRKRRKLRGEDDTDRDVRFAREDAAIAAQARHTLHKHDVPDAEIVDAAGHIQLIPPPDDKTTRQIEKNAEVEAEKAKKRKREEDQYTMRFSNAAGFNNDVGSKPWYASNKLARAIDTEKESAPLVLANIPEKDVWGNNDPKRKGRESSRISANDPFAAMQHAQRQLKQSERDREQWARQRLEEVQDVGKDELKTRDKRRRRRSEDHDSLEDFSLDGPTVMAGGDPNGEHARRRHRRHHRHRSRSRSKERHRRHHHHRSHRVDRERA